MVNGDRIWLDPLLNQRERRCTLTHELLHVERGTACGSAVEEHIVNLLAAKRLITLDELVDGYLWVRHPGAEELAEQLWVDLPTLCTRMANLDRVELAELDFRLESDWSWTEPPPSPEAHRT